MAGYGSPTQQGQVAFDPANVFGKRKNRSQDQQIGEMLDPIGVFGNKKGSSILGPSGYEVDQQVSDAQFRQPLVPGSSGELANIMRVNTDNAAKYRASIPSSVKKDSDLLYSDYSKQARSGLAKDIKDTRASFNARGLLNSGMRAGAEMGAQANTQADLANFRANTNKSLLDSRMNAANTMENNALNAGYAYAGSSPTLGAGALYGQGQDQANDIYNSRLQQQGIADAVGAGTSLAGTIYANKNKRHNQEVS